MEKDRCPLCGDDNACGMAAGATTCWCFSTPVPEDVLARVPPDQRNAACICERCATRQTRQAEAAPGQDHDTRSSR